MTLRSSLRRRIGIAVALSLAALGVGAGVAAASNVVVGLSDTGEVTVPTWLYLATGGGVVGAAAVLTMLVTDRTVLDDYHGRSLGFPSETLLRAGSLLLGAVGVVGLLFALAVGVAGPQGIGLTSATVLLTFVGVRALLTMVAYGVGNPWRAINPWRRIAAVLPSRNEPYPERLGSWPAVGGLLLFVWLEVVAPLSSAPRMLVAVLLGYTAVTLAAAASFSPEEWFRRGDPLSVWFRLYGAVAPIQRTDDGLEFRFPAARLTDGDVVTDRSAVAFVLALVWELTYNGFVVTPPGAATVEFFVGLGLPAELVYLALLVAGFAGFWRVYWFAASRSRERAETYLSRRYLAVRFAPPLLAIAAGYHFAHYVGFTIALWPQLLDTLVAPLAPDPNPTQLALTSWFGYVEIAGILLGHVLAVWVAHAVSFELFPGKLQAIRSQYPFVAVMVFFTMLSLYLVSLPTASPPYVPA
ncbi:hypothetical protein [Salinilacihabitans rarus]|uniref:hypothetical protein n=1 Tax=Salinilacihabitans rarus TaxID=2961596 RepID=UPI0020C887AF|nr:hypothetical protein [Salinilacihabitans rarus]